MKFKVNVTVTAKKTYTYEIDARNERRAQDAACDKAVDAFHAEHYIESADDVDIESEQQTQECEECGKEYAVPTSDNPDAPLAWKEDYCYCAECGEQILAKESAEVSDARYTATAMQRKAGAR